MSNMRRRLDQLERKISANNPESSMYPRPLFERSIQMMRHGLKQMGYQVSEEQVRQMRLDALKEIGWSTEHLST